MAANELAVDRDLIIGGHVHKGEQVTFRVQELILFLFQRYTLNGFIRAQALVHFRAVTNVLQFNLQERATLARLYVLCFDCPHQAALVLNDISWADGITVDFH